MTTRREMIDRQAQVARLIASGATPTEVARVLGVNRATVYRDLAAIRARALDRVLMGEEEEAAAIDAELGALDSLFASARRAMEERTEPGSSQHAAMLNALAKLKQTKLHAAAELGVYRKAPQRHVLLEADELARLEGEELEQYMRDLEKAEARITRARRSK